jgi:hypothetical protein
MMIKRPKLTLEVDGTYDEVYDYEALQLQKLVAMVMKKSGEENTKHARTALTVDVLEDVYDDLKDDDALQKLQAKLKKVYKDEATYKRAYQKELIKLCASIQKVSQEQLDMLAKERVASIRRYLVDEKAINPNRVKEGAIVKLSSSDKKELHLKLNIEVKSEDK